jgi:hypothetical protein
MSAQAFQFAYKARLMKNNIGTRAAAGFLRNRDVSLKEALFILVGRPL